MSVVEDVQGYLVAEGLVDGVTSWPSCRRMVHDDSDALVVITEDGGPQPEIPAAQGVGSAALAELGVQVLVRGNPGDSDEASAKALAIHRLLHGLRGSDLNDLGYRKIRAMTAGPVFIGFDETNRPQFTSSFLLSLLSSAL